MGYIDFELYIKKYVPPQNTLSLLPPNRYFFTTQILGGHVTSCNQGLSSNDQGRQKRESLGTRLRAERQNQISMWHNRSLSK